VYVIEQVDPEASNGNAADRDGKLGLGLLLADGPMPILHAWARV
jgi:hypothetical protein